MNEISEKRKKFVDLAERRVNRAVPAIKSIGNLSNSANYEYNDKDVKDILNALRDAVKEVQDRFQGTTKKDETFRLKAR